MKKKLSIATILSISIIMCAMVAAGNLSSTGVQGALVPVFGNTVIGTIMDQNDANAQSISYFTTTSTGLVTDIMAYIDGASSGNAIAAIYSVSGNAAGALLAQSKPVTLRHNVFVGRLSTGYTIRCSFRYDLRACNYGQCTSKRHDSWRNRTARSQCS